MKKSVICPSLSPKSSKKGLTGGMLIIVFVIIIMIISAVLGSGIIGEVAGMAIGKDAACPTYCDIQSGIQGYSFWADRVGQGLIKVFTLGKYGNVIGTGEIASEKLMDYAINPEAMGCFCGVSEREGKYIHSHFRDEDGNFAEFHITKDHPGIHLMYNLLESEGDNDENIIYTHRVNEDGGKEACKEALENANVDQLNSLSDLEDYPACIIFSTTQSGECALWEFNESSALWNKEGETIKSIGEGELLGSSKGENVNIDGDPVYSLPIGNPVDVHIGELRRKFQLLLLKRYWEGTHPFELHAPVVCQASEKEGRKSGAELDEACAEQCQESDQILWGSGCFKKGEAPLNYEMLETDEEKFCEEEGGEAMCLCVAETEYTWKVDGEYKPEA